MASVSGAAAAPWEVCVVINYVSLGTAADVAEACSSVHLFRCLDLLVYSNFGRFGSRFLATLIYVIILNLRDGSDALKPKSERAAAHPLDSPLVKAGASLVTVDAVVPLTFCYVRLTRVYGTLRALWHA